MKVLVAPSWYPPSGGHFFRRQAAYLHQRGHRVKVAALHWHPFLRARPALPAPADFEERHHFISRYPKADLLNWRRWMRRYEHILEAAVGDFRPDVIYVHSVVMAGPAVRAVARRHGIPYAILEHRARFFYAARDRLLGTFQVPLREALQYAHRLAAVSSALAEALVQWKGPAPSPPAVLPNPLSAVPELPTSSPAGPFTFLTVGRPHPVKGWDLALEAVQRLHGEGAGPFRWVVIGDQQGTFARAVQKTEAAAIVKVLPALPHAELAPYYRQAHALLHPSRYEAFGMVILEGLSYGLPVVATRSGGPEDLIQPDQNGLLADPDPAALAAAMRTLMEGYARFDPPAIARHTHQMYHPDRVMAMVERWLTP